MDSDEPEDPRKKVVSLRFRRKHQAKDADRTSGDPVAMLADEITQLLGEQQLREVQNPDKAKQFEFACNQLLAQLFATNALMKVLMHSLGPEMYNSVIVEVTRREHHYRIQTPWPQDSADTTTYTDFIKKGEEQFDADVIPLRPKVTCPRCHGTGLRHDRDRIPPRKCNKCDGEGEISSPKRCDDRGSTPSSEKED